MTSPSARGEFRTIPVGSLYGSRYLALSPSARLVWFTLRMVCGPLGIQVMPGLSENLRVLTGLTAKTVSKALDELCGGGMVRVDGLVVWVVDAMAEDGSLNLSPNHKKYVRQALSTLPSSSLHAEFRSRYAAWFDPALSGGAGEAPPEAPSEGLGIPYPSTTQHNTRSSSASAEEDASVCVGWSHPRMIGFPDPPLAAVLVPAWRTFVEEVGDSLLGDLADFLREYAHDPESAVRMLLDAQDLASPDGVVLGLRDLRLKRILRPSDQQVRTFAERAEKGARERRRSRAKAAAAASVPATATIPVSPIPAPPPPPVPAAVEPARAKGAPVSTRVVVGQILPFPLPQRPDE